MLLLNMKKYQYYLSQIVLDEDINDQRTYENHVDDIDDKVGDNYEGIRHLLQ